MKSETITEMNLMKNLKNAFQSFKINKKNEAEKISKIFTKRVIIRKDKCTCHERDSSQVCSYCYNQGYRGYFQEESSYYCDECGLWSDKSICDFCGGEISENK